MLHSIGAVVAGYAAMAVLVMAGTMAWMILRVPGGMNAIRERRPSGDTTAMPAPPPAYLAFNLTLSLFAAVLGGWITGGLAPSAPTGHRIGLGAIMVIMAFVTARSPGPGRQPGWYRFVLPLIALAGVALSTLLGRSAGG